MSARSLRYYEEQGLLRSARTPGGQREYSEDAEQYVRFVQHRYAAGLSSARIGELLPCFSSRSLDTGQRAMLQNERDRPDGRIAELQTARAQLERVITAAEARALASA